MIACAEKIYSLGQRNEPQVGDRLYYDSFTKSWSENKHGHTIKQGDYLGDDMVMVFYTQKPVGPVKSYHYSWLGDAHLVLPCYE